MSSFYADKSEKLMDSKSSVIIIGAGASGIGAARALYEAGFNPIILEARERIGGRIHMTTMIPNLVENNNENLKNNFIQVQLGANWIHGLNEKVNPMYKVARKLDLLLHQTSSDDEPGDDVLLFDSITNSSIGEQNYQKSKDCIGVVGAEDYRSALERYNWIKNNFDNTNEIAPEKISSLSLREGFEACITASEKFFGPCDNLQRRCINWFLDRVAIDTGSPLALSNVKSYTEGDSCGQYGEAIIISGGYYRIINYLAKEYPLDIRCNKVVQSIDYEGDTVAVTCADGETFSSNFCIVTTPLSVLSKKLIQLPPSVTPPFLEMAPKLGMSLMNLVWLWFPYQFWPVGYNFLGLTRDTLDVPSTFTTFLAPHVLDRFGHRQPVLMCQVVGSFAEEIEQMSECDIAAMATETLRNMFHAAPVDLLTCDPVSGLKEVPNAIGCVRSQWRSDPLAGGSWTFYPYKAKDGGSGECSVSNDQTYNSLSKKNDSFERILFAGEATNEDFRGTVHGAFISGINAAEKIIPHLPNEEEDEEDDLLFDISGLSNGISERAKL